MLLIDSGRVSNPKDLSPSEVVAACEGRKRFTVQFSDPEAYPPATIEALNEACSLAGDQIEVRFFGHYGTAFDASVLRQIPAVRNLSLDCLSHITFEDHIGRLPSLVRLNFGVFEFDRPEFLETLQIERLWRLALGETRRRNMNLSVLSKGEALEELFVHGHSRGIEATSNLPRLDALTLSGFPRSQSLEFVTPMGAIKRLSLFLGGRGSIDEVSSHTLEVLQIMRVRGLASLGTLARFPALKSLQVEDQLQLEQLDLAGVSLERLRVDNCKRLVEVRALEKQDQLRELWASRVALDLDELRDRSWPGSARSINLLSNSQKWNDDTRQQLAANGLSEEPSPWS